MKGQVTIYVILGIVIVVALMGVFILRDYILKSDYEREAEKFKVSDDIQPVYEYFVNCIGEVTYDSLKLISSQGGYLEIENYKYPINPLVPFTNRLDIFNNNALQVPYWFYETSNGIQELKIPSLDKIQQDLNQHVKDNVNLCTNNFSLFEEYNIRNFDNVDVETQITDNKVYVKVDSELDVIYKGVEQKINNIYVVVNTDFGLLYNNAVKLFNKIYQENFIEEKTIDMLVLYDQLPFSFTEFSCEKRVWNKQKVIEDFKKILELNTNKYHVAGNDYFSLKSDIDSNIYFSYSKDWPFDIDIGPSDNDIMKGDELTYDSFNGNFLRNIFCINDYKFIYNVKYPVLIKLSSDLDFLFAYEVIIKNNQAKVNLVEQSFEIKDNKLCLNKIMPTEVYTYDDNMNNLGDVKIQFKCFDTVCDIGDTDSNGYLRMEFPQCFNGLIIAKKEGYNDAELLSSTNVESQNTLLLDKIRNLDFEVKLIDTNTGLVRDVNNENIQVYLMGSSGYEIYLDQSSSVISLVPDIYEITSFVTTEENVKIEKQTISECTSVPKKGLLGLIFKEDKCFDIDIGGFDLDNIIIGGNKFNLIISENDLNNNKMTFYINVYNTPKTQEEILELYNKISLGEGINGFKHPEYKN